MQNAKCKMQNSSDAVNQPPIPYSLLPITCDLPPAWDALLNHPFDREPFRRTLLAVEAAAALETVYPPRADWFAAFRLTPPERVRVVILGQDPYHEPDQAMGLAFSVRQGVKLPPSLRNIYQELKADLGVPAPSSGDLSPWAEQGVLLLNTVLTVAAGRADSHRSLGWQALTNEIIAAVSALPQPVAFLLWGAPAKRAFVQAMQNAKCKMQNEGSGIRDQGSGITAQTEEEPPLLAGHNSPGDCCGFHCRCGGCAAATGILKQGDRPQGRWRGASGSLPGPRLILEAPHPSPLSAYRGFFGSRPFSQINEFLSAHGEAPIRWTE